MSRPQRQAVVLILDGLGDLPVAALGGRTPLEAADTPCLDRWAAGGRCGLVDPILPGEVPNTDSGVGLLLGLRPEQTSALHRGPVEAAGAGLAMRPGDVALRANFATVEWRDGSWWVLDRRAGRITSGADELAAALDGMDLLGGVRAQFRSTDQHRGVLVLSGNTLNPEVSDTDPGDGTLPARVWPCRGLRPEADATATWINRFIGQAAERLAAHEINRARQTAGKPPANGLLTRGPGAWFEPDNRLRALGLRAATVSGCNTVLGLARLFGFDTVEDPKFTASLDTDMDAKVAAALAALADHDIVYLHVKAPDLCAHDRQPLAKRDFLERFDRALAPLAGADVVVALTSDHTTDSNRGTHTADPVPSLLISPATATPAGSEVQPFGETTCRSGTLPRQRSHQFLDCVLRAMGLEP